MKYDHLYTLAFSVISEREDGEDVTEQMLATAVVNRVLDLYGAQEFSEACAGPEDTEEVQG